MQRAHCSKSRVAYVIPDLIRELLGGRIYVEAFTFSGTATASNAAAAEPILSELRVKIMKPVMMMDLGRN
jgi:hypothetical protein